MNKYIFGLCQGNKNKLQVLVAASYEDAIEKAKEEIDNHLNLDDDTYNLLDSIDDWTLLRQELSKQGIGITYLRDIEEL